MTERAQVVRVDGDMCTVRCSTGANCESCSDLACRPRERTYRARLTASPAGAGASDYGPAAAAVSPGDWVEVEIPDAGALWKGLLLFAGPIVLFVAAYALAGSSALGLARMVGSALETVRVVAGFAGLALGFGLAVLVSGSRREPGPRVIRVYRAPVLEPFEPAHADSV